MLFKSIGYQKRSSICTFIPLVQSLDERLLYSPKNPRALGVALAQRLSNVPDLFTAIAAEFKDWDTRSAPLCRAGW